MKRPQLIFLVAGLVLIGAGAGVLARLKAGQKLGSPGLKTSPIPGGKNLHVELPERVGDYDSKALEISPDVTNALPRDTSYGQRMYQAADGFHALMNVVLMGSDRTSIHQPQFCLEGGGWHIDEKASRPETLTMIRPQAYDLPVMKLVATKQGEVNGQSVTVRGVYVYWFVSADRLTAQHWQRMWWMAEHLLRTGELERWAYVTCFAVCEPGREDATFDRMKVFLASAVPQFQLVAGNGVKPAATAKQ